MTEWIDPETVNQSINLRYKNSYENYLVYVSLHMCLFVATLAILENVPQGQKNVFIPAMQDNCVPLI